MSNRLSVWWDGRVTGCLYLGPDGDTQFAYDAAWLAGATAPALSFSLPKQTEPFNRRACQAFFAVFCQKKGSALPLPARLVCLPTMNSGCSNISAAKLRAR